MYPNGLANEVVKAFEVYVGDVGSNTYLVDDPEQQAKNAEAKQNEYQIDIYAQKKKVNPKEQE
jgi:hypothetical protein